MKNIHILPTNNPLQTLGIGLKLGINNNLFLNGQHQNIYITSDEEIKDGTYFYNSVTNGIDVCIEVYNEKAIEGKKGTYNIEFCKKIILTTDQDLIKDGVQEVEEDFLNWFVKNPSCESVEVEKGYRGIDLFNYKIIIPKEEPKQECSWSDIEEGCVNDECKCEKKYIVSKQETLEEAKKQQFKYDNLQDAKEISSRIKVVETLEEAAERLQKDKYGIFISKDANVKGQFVINTAKAAFLSGMNEGAKWQQEQYELTVEDIRRDEAFKFELKGIEMFSDGYDAGYKEAEKKLYSEEEVYTILEKFRNLPLIQFQEWFEQFKKK